MEVQQGLGNGVWTRDPAMDPEKAMISQKSHSAQNFI
jgi:hypothetical protein